MTCCINSDNINAKNNCPLTKIVKTNKQTNKQTYKQTNKQKNTVAQ